MKAFVTGGTGLLGTNLVYRLLAGGHEVKALARSPEKASRVLGGTGAGIVIGDMRAVELFAGQLDGCEVLFHTAAYFRESLRAGRNEAEAMAVNVQGTMRLFEEAGRRGVRQIVYVSAAGLVGMKPAGEAGDESTGSGTVAGSSEYFRSKLEAERALKAFRERSPARVIDILPGWMFGPHDGGPTGSGLLVLNYLQRRIKARLDGGTCVVDARDVAEAMVRAVEREGEGRYIAAGVFMTIDEIFRALEEVSGVPGPRWRLPYRIVLALAWLGELGSRLTGRPVMVTVENVRLMHARLRVDSGRAIRELGIEFRPFRETLRDEIAWLRQNGVRDGR